MCSWVDNSSLLLLFSDFNSNEIENIDTERKMVPLCMEESKFYKPRNVLCSF